MVCSRLGAAFGAVTLAACAASTADRSPGSPPCAPALDTPEGLRATEPRPPVVRYVPRTDDQPQGWAHLCYAIDEAGRPSNVRVLAAEPDAVRGLAAEVLLRTVRSLPAEVDGRPTRLLGQEAVLVFGTCSPPSSVHARQAWAQGAAGLGPVSRVEPLYPRRAAELGLEGHVLLDFGLDPEGQVLDIQVVESEPPGVFDEAAKAALWQWRYCPLSQLEGQERRSVVTIRFAPDPTPGEEGATAPSD